MADRETVVCILKPIAIDDIYVKILKVLLLLRATAGRADCGRLCPSKIKPHQVPHMAVALGCEMCVYFGNDSSMAGMLLLCYCYYYCHR